MSAQRLVLFISIDIVLAGFVVLTVPLYIAVLIMVIKKRKIKEFQSSYFRVLISLGIADIYLILSNYSFRQIPRWFFYEETIHNTTLATVAKMHIWYVYYAQVFGVLIGIVNRYTAYKHPTRHKKIWHKHLKMIIICQWTIPFFPIIPMFFPGFGSRFANETMYPVFQDPEVHSWYFSIDVVFECLIMGPLMLYFVIGTVMALRTHKVTVAVRAHGETSELVEKAEKRVLVLGLYLAIVYILISFTVYLLYIKLWPVFTSYAFYGLVDIFTAANPYFLLWCSSALRKSFKQLFRMKFMRK